MRKQVKFTFQIGYAEPHHEFEKDIINAASALCGGCTTSHKSGWWTTDGATHAATFSGTVEGEHCFELELTCELAKAELVYDAMTYGIAAAAQYWAIDTNWVHVTEVEMTGRHFSIAAINAANAA